MARVLIPLARGCEEMEAVTVIDLPRCAQIEVISSRGPGTAIDFALQPTESLAGMATPDEVETALVREL
jgi:hypothetical protein